MTERDIATEGPDLQSLRGARPPKAVEDRIIAGAISTVEAAPTRLPLMAGLSFAAMVAVAIAVAVFDEEGAPENGAKRGTETVAKTLASNTTASFERREVGPHEIRYRLPTSLEIVEAHPSVLIQLNDGTADFHVAPLSAKESFTVRTRHLRAIVVGTRFEVEANEECSVVRVQEGKVLVQIEGRPDQSLSSDQSVRRCDQNPSTETSSREERLMREALVIISAGKDLSHAAELLEKHRRLYPDSLFAEEALFHLAVVNARMGNQTQANTLAEQFIDRFPESSRAKRLREWLSAAAKDQP